MEKLLESQGQNVSSCPQDSISAFWVFFFQLVVGVFLEGGGGGLVLLVFKGVVCNYLSCICHLLLFKNSLFSWWLGFFDYWIHLVFWFLCLLWGFFGLKFVLDHHLKSSCSGDQLTILNTFSSLYLGHNRELLQKMKFRWFSSKYSLLRLFCLLNCGPSLYLPPMLPPVSPVWRIPPPGTKKK